MKIVSEILFIVSNGLMIPVILLLLYFLVKAICFCSRFLKIAELSTLQ